MLDQDQIKRVMRMAYRHAIAHSHDTSTHVGAILRTLSAMESDIFGANRFTHVSFDIPANHERPRKYQLIEHAERWVIFEAARRGYQLKYAELICPWATCTDCARAIVRSGIQRVYAHQDAYNKTPERWRGEVELGIKILEASGVEYVRYSGKIGDCENLFNGEIWYP